MLAVVLESRDVKSAETNAVPVGAILPLARPSPRRK